MGAWCSLPGAGEVVQMAVNRERSPERRHCGAEFPSPAASPCVNPVYLSPTSIAPPNGHRAWWRGKGRIAWRKSLKGGARSP